MNGQGSTRARMARMTVKLSIAAVFAAAAMAVAAAAGQESPEMPQDGYAAAQAGSLGAFADSDGHVPVYNACLTGGEYENLAYSVADQYTSSEPYPVADQYASAPFPEADQYAGSEPYPVAQYASDPYAAGFQYAIGAYGGEQLGFYNWHTDGFATYGTITIDECALDRLGAGPNDRQRLLAHERGHANGLPHSSDPSDVMYPFFPITGS